MMLSEAHSYKTIDMKIIILNQFVSICIQFQLASAIRLNDMKINCRTTSQTRIDANARVSFILMNFFTRDIVEMLKGINPC